MISCSASKDVFLENSASKDGQEQGKSGLNPALHSRHSDLEAQPGAPMVNTAHQKTGSLYLDLQCVAEPPKAEVVLPELVWIRPTATSWSAAQARTCPGRCAFKFGTDAPYRTATRRSFTNSTPNFCGSSAPRPRPVSDWQALPPGRSVVAFHF